MPTTLTTYYLISPASPGFDQLPRAVKIAVRKAKIINQSPVKPAQETRTSIDSDIYSGSAFGEADDPHYLTRNNIDADFDIDGSQEFCDSDGSEELHGLTIVEPGNGNIRRWLKGYDIL